MREQMKEYRNIQQQLTITSNNRIARDVYEMRLRGDVSGVTRPGQFINIKLDGFYLRRPISVCDWENDSLTIIYKVVGKGTEVMSGLKAGDCVDALTGLGNGFDTAAAGAHPLLIGGGVGTPPMYGLAKRLVLSGRSVNVILGFNAAEDVFYADRFDALNEFYDFGCEGVPEGCERPSLKVYTATVTGETGIKGFVTDCLGEISECSHYYVCGPLPMLKAVKGAMKARFADAVGELSFEERMGCGFGVCVGCSIETADGPKKVCKDGPVFLSTGVNI